MQPRRGAGTRRAPNGRRVFEHLTVSMSADQIARLEALGARTGQTISAIVEDAVLIYLAAEEEVR
jgi:hypothetical protein